MRRARTHAWIGLALVLALGWWSQPARSDTQVTANLPPLPLTVGNGGTGVATLALNGVLYGNAAGVVLVTAQGPANSVLAANAGAPSFSATPTIGGLLTLIAAGAGGQANLLESLVDTTAAQTGTGPSIRFDANRTTGGQTQLASIAGIITDITNGTPKGAMLLSTINSGGGAPVERVRIDTVGNVGIGVTSVADAKLQVAGHYVSSGTTPTMGTCGTSPSVIGTDQAGQITTGSSATLSCTVNFGTAWTTLYPICTGSWVDQNLSIQVNPSTSSILFTYASSTSKTINYVCVGRA